ncbi:hypothetical protein H0H93_012591 [Arthromyces matolae]|nr:hypothetical protein H0H93_012591 [Arthromyces matolae]
MAWVIYASFAWTTAIDIVIAIGYATMPNTLVFLGIQFLLAKLYINSFLAMYGRRLNARQTIRDKDSSGVQSLSSSKILHIRTTTSTHVVGEDLGSSYSPQEDKTGVSLSPLGAYKNTNYFDHDMTIPHGTRTNRDVHAV